MSHHTHTHTHAARRGGNNPVQVARRQQQQLLPWFAMALCAVLAGIILSDGDLSQAERLALRAAVCLAAVVMAALLRCMIRLEGRITTLHAEQRAASRAAAQRRSIR